MDAVELLAPARDLATGQAAINCGADAVYIGAARFGAREASGNPLDEIEQLARYAHRYWARVYVTVNTLLRDDELPAAVTLIRQLYELGADAIILQDAGLLECDLPPIALFASTQMHNHTPERVAFLQQVGVRRAILARELSLAQIAAVRAAAPQIELESFIHGALCVSYSGQCYLSYAAGGRSGNRGQCAQPCRRPYRLVDSAGRVLAENRHLLSLRDLNLSGRLGDLLAAGVRSFKIEGRLKDRGYVMNVVAHYRAELDRLLANAPGLRAASSGRVALDFTPNPAKTFNRGFTTYFLDDRQGNPLTAWDTPKPLGEPLGRVAALSARSFTLAPLEIAGDTGAGAIRGAAQGEFSPGVAASGSTLRSSANPQKPGKDARSPKIGYAQNTGTPGGAATSGEQTARKNISCVDLDITAGDGLCWLVPAGPRQPQGVPELVGALVQRVEGRQIFPARMDGLAVGTLVYRNHDHAFLSALDKSRAGRRIGLRFTLAAGQDGLVLRVVDTDGVQAQAGWPGPLEPAGRPESARETILRQLRKLGGTAFECLEARLELPVIPFLPLAGLNALRRDALDALVDARHQARPLLPARGPEQPGTIFPSQTLTFEGNVLNRQAEAFYRRHGVTRIEPAAESGLDMRGRRVMTTRYCLRQQLGACRKYPLPGQGPLRLAEPLTLVDDDGARYPLRFDCARCVMEVYFQEGPP